MKQYYMPTKVITGKQCIRKHGAAFAELGKKAMIVTGRNSAKKCGALDDVTTVLENNGQSYVIYDKVMNNPTVDCVYEGADLAKEEQVDFVVAIGGGSPMDAAKAMALLALNDVPKKDIFSGMAGKTALPMIHVATTAGTGSEVTPYAILTNDEKETKTSISSVNLFPKYAFLDETYLQQLPRHTLIHTVLDSLSHSMEGMLSVRAGIITDGMALQAIAMIGQCFQKLLTDSLSDGDRKNLLIASTLGGMVIANTGTTIVHSMGYSLTYFHGADHGRANGLLLPAFLKVAQNSYPQKVEKMLEALEMKSLDQFDKMVRQLLGERESLTEKQIKKYVELSKNSKNIANCVVPITEEEIRKIFMESVG